MSAQPCTIVVRSGHASAIDADLLAAGFPLEACGGAVSGVQSLAVPLAEPTGCASENVHAGFTAQCRAVEVGRKAVIGCRINQESGRLRPCLNVLPGLRNLQSRGDTEDTLWELATCQSLQSIGQGV